MRSRSWSSFKLGGTFSLCSMVGVNKRLSRVSKTPRSGHQVFRRIWSLGALLLRPTTLQKPGNIPTKKLERRCGDEVALVVKLHARGVLELLWRGRSEEELPQALKTPGDMTSGLQAGGQNTYVTLPCDSCGARASLMNSPTSRCSSNSSRS